MPTERLRFRSILTAVLPSRPFLLVILVSGLGVVLFALARLFFLLSYTDRVAGAPLTDILRCFLTGIRFDLVVVAFILAPVIMLLPWFNLQSKAVRLVTVTYLTSMYSVATLLSLVDIRFFSYFNTHLNSLALEYLDQGPTARNLVLADPKFTSFTVIWVIATVFIYFVLKRLYLATRSFPGRRSWPSHVVYFILLAGLSFLAIRGRTATAGINWSMAIVGDNPFVNQLPLNSVYALGYSVYERDHDARLIYRSDEERGYPLEDFPAGLEYVENMLGLQNDEWLDPDKSILRRSRQAESPRGFAPNLVIVVMESWSAEFTGCLGDRRNLTPSFDSLAASGILFTDLYASGIRSNWGLAALLCSFPAMPGRSILKRYEAKHPFVALSEILHQRGYYNAFIYGGDPAFDHMQGFFTAKQYDAFYGDSHFGKDLYFSKWGIPDHVLLGRAAPLIDSLPRPFQATVFTLSYHEPFELPDSSVKRFEGDSLATRMYNCQLYADHAIGQFVGELRERPVFDSTIFVFVSDHTKIHSSRYELDRLNFHIPLLIYSPALIGAQAIRVNKVGSQTDLIPTLMHVLGGDYVHASWGRDLLRLPQDDPGFAAMNIFDIIAYIDNRYLYIEPIGSTPILYLRSELDGKEKARDIHSNHRDDFLTIQKRLRTYLQIADQLSTPSAQ
jgi:phosphoglycerol transferase MdoB-like AlkP superfamily enzyme